MKVVFSLAALIVPAGMVFGQSANPAAPGTVNYVEGQVAIDGKAVNKANAGKTAVAEGGTLTTGNGKAEMLLTPGVFLRMGANSAVTLVKPDLTHTEVELERGKADVEVDQIYKQNDLLVDQDGQKVKLLQDGLYAFDTEEGTLQVFNGKAAVMADDGDGATKGQTVKGGRELALNGADAKPAKFDKKAAEDGLYDFSNLRSNYLGEANAQLAGQYPNGNGFAPGWAWNSGFAGYTWLPGDGAFLSPFGYGFYSPLAFYGFGGYPGYYGGYGLGGYGYGGGYGGGYARNSGGLGYRHGVYSGPVGKVGGVGAPGGVGAAGFRGGAAASGFHGGTGAAVGGFHGGGAAMSGGGAHGGGGGHR